ncbi:MAG TPA: hypothetical protein VHP36_04730 [Chitinispirillaceae bacterium]|nr:hypothetical protein [Chitinispirillaceae bacterium]
MSIRKRNAFLYMNIRSDFILLINICPVQDVFEEYNRPGISFLNGSDLAAV